MFIKKLHNNRQKLATYVLAVFSVVFACDFLCDFGVINKAPAHRINGSHDHEVAIDEHHRNHHSYEHGVHLPSNEAHDHEKASDEDCCQEETSQFYASLVKHELPVFDLDKIVVTLDLPWSLTYPTYRTHLEPDPSTLKNALSPPLTGLYARILFQSFLC